MCPSCHDMACTIDNIHGKEIHPIVLLVVDCTPEVLFEDLVYSSDLAITFEGGAR